VKGGRAQRMKRREYARHLYAMHGQSVCPRCGVRGAHFAPPCLGQPGFWMCEERP
jgi:hypothetical protein